MSALLTLWVWLQTRIASTRRGEDGWGAIEWMVIMVFVVGLAYGANVAAEEYLEVKAQDLWSND